MSAVVGENFDSNNLAIVDCLVYESKSSLSDSFVQLPRKNGFAARTAVGVTFRSSLLGSGAKPFLQFYGTEYGNDDDDNRKNCSNGRNASCDVDRDGGWTLSCDCGGRDCGGRRCK